MLPEQEKYSTMVLELSGDEHLQTICKSLSENVEIYEKAMALIADPSEAKPKIVFDYFVNKWRLWTLDRMQSKHYLIALDCLELWYMVQGVECPFPKRLAEQREYFEKEIKNES